MWPNARITELLEIEHPIILSPMSLIGSPELAASVCNAGGLGSIGCAMLSPEAATDEVRTLRRLTDKPFSLNFFCHTAMDLDPVVAGMWLEQMLPYYREFGIEADRDAPRLVVHSFSEEMCRLVEDVRPAVVSFHFGLPMQDFVSRIKASGSLIMSSATSVEEAVWLEEFGADIIVAQGIEAGGHRGSFLAADVDNAILSQLGTFALVPQIADAVNVPVVAAGGIADGRGIAAAFALGAAGVQLGTAYLPCPETRISPLYREALRTSRSGRTVLTNVFTGRPARVFANRLVEDAGPISKLAPAFPHAMYATAKLATETQKKGLADFSPFWAGQASPLGRELPGKALTFELVEEARQCFLNLSGQLAG